MTSLKPFIRITFLSIILAFLLIYLGIKFHWGDQLQLHPRESIELQIPDQANTDTQTNSPIIEKPIVYSPEIIESNDSNNVLASMNKEQITEQCENLLSKELKDALTLELATVNCVVSNFQETFQDIRLQSAQVENELKQLKMVFEKQCSQKYQQIIDYSPVEKQLMVGICVSDKLNRN